ncbi:MAG: hypothetical protein ACK46L_05580 [Synechococcaceae cyanobacterium]|jgi:hypothetical protein
MLKVTLCLLASCIGGLTLARPAHALRLSASSAGDPLGPGPNPASVLNTIGLPLKQSVLVPMPPFNTSLTSLAAPGSPGTNTDTILGFAYGSNTTAVQFQGDALSSITTLSSGGYDIDLVLTNFMFTTNSFTFPPQQGEYYYLNIWETFTGLSSSIVNWSGTGNVSINGFYHATSPQEGFNIEPIASVVSGSSWQAASAFFNPVPVANGPFSSSTAIFTAPSLGSYVSGGSLTVGLESILLAYNQDNVSGDFIHLPTSLELKLHLKPAAVPGPLPASGALLAWRFSRSLRRRLRS